jgi:hypothetical protein
MPNLPTIPRLQRVKICTLKSDFKGHTQLAEPPPCAPRPYPHHREMQRVSCATRWNTLVCIGINSVRAVDVPQLVKGREAAQTRR